MLRIFGVAGKNGVVPLAGDGTKEQRKCCLCMRAEVCVCRPGRIKNKAGGRLTRTEAGPATQGWGFVRMRAEVCVCRSGRIKDKAGERPVRADGGTGGSRMGFGAHTGGSLCLPFGTDKR